MFLFVGLGNPGLRYKMTRHNIGYLVLQRFADRMGWILNEDRRFNAKIAKGVFQEQTIHLLMPLTYMNLSGESLRRYTDYLKIPISQVVVIVDDIALPFGQLRLREGGSAGGHNGLKSIEACLGTSYYKRLRLGIGHPGEKGLADYVLEMFNRAELDELPAFIDRGGEVLQNLLNESFTRVMNNVNTVSTQKECGLKPIDLTKPPVTG